MSEGVKLNDLSGVGVSVSHIDGSFDTSRGAQSAYGKRIAVTSYG